MVLTHAPHDFQKHNTNISHSPSPRNYYNSSTVEELELVAHLLEELILCLSLSTNPTVVFGSILTILNRIIS